MAEFRTIRIGVWARRRGGGVDGSKDIVLAPRAFSRATRLLSFLFVGNLLVHKVLFRFTDWRW